MAVGVFFSPLHFALRRRHLRVPGRRLRIYSDPVVLINAAIGAYLLASLYSVFWGAQSGP